MPARSNPAWASIHHTAASGILALASPLVLLHMQAAQPLKSSIEWGLAVNVTAQFGNALLCIQPPFLTPCRRSYIQHGSVEPPGPCRALCLELCSLFATLPHCLTCCVLPSYFLLGRRSWYSCLPANSWSLATAPVPAEVGTHHVKCEGGRCQFDAQLNRQTAQGVATAAA